MIGAVVFVAAFVFVRLVTKEGSIPRVYLDMVLESSACGSCVYSALTEATFAAGFGWACFAVLAIWWFIADGVKLATLLDERANEDGQ